MRRRIASQRARDRGAPLPHGETPPGLKRTGLASELEGSRSTSTLEHAVVQAARQLLYVGGDWREASARRTLPVEGTDSNPMAPFGGVKASGVGRAGGPHGIDANHETQHMAPAR